MTLTKTLTKTLSAALLATTLAVAACGSNGDDAPKGEPPVTEELSADQAAKWAETWCSIEPGVSRDDLVAAMGEPTSGTQQVVSWDGFGFHFNAFLDVHGNVWQMDGYGPAPDDVRCGSARQASTMTTEQPTSTDSASAPTIDEVVDIMKTNGATEAEVQEMVDYATTLPAEEISDYLHLVAYTWAN
jgi:hypothetical protein